MKDISTFGDAGFIAKQLKGMSIDGVAKALHSAGVDEDSSKNIMKAMGFDPAEIAENITDIFADAPDAIGNITSAFSKLGSSIKNVGTGLLSFAKSNWAILAALAVAAVAVGVAYNNSFSKLTENAKESKAALSETTSEIESLQSQKQSNSDKIAELSSSKESEKANESEIASLERQNALLQAQIDLKKKTEEDQRKEASEDAYKALSKQFQVTTGEMYYDNGNVVAVTESKDIVDITADDISRLDELQSKYNEVTDKLKTYQDQQAEGHELSEEEQRDYDNLTKQAENYQSQMDNLESSINKNKSTIFELYESLLNPDGTAITGFETMANKILAIFPELTDGSSGLSENMQSISDAYREATSGMGDNSALVKDFNKWLLGLSETDQDIVYELSLKTDTANYSLQDWQAALAETKAQIEGLSEIPIDMEAETSGIEAVTSAINESASATGLAATSISELKSRYRDLDGFDASALFENTSTGVKLNTRELTRLEKQYENLNKQKLSDSLKQLYKDYEDLTKQIEEYSDKSETAVEDLEAQRKATLDDIDYVKQLAAEYDGLTSAYAEWVNAQSATQSGTWYDSAKEGLDSLKELYKSGDYGNTALQEGLEYFTNADITGIDNWYDRMQAIDAAYKQLDTTIAGTKYSINDFMAGGQDGCNN